MKSVAVNVSQLFRHAKTKQRFSSEIRMNMVKLNIRQLITIHSTILLSTYIVEGTPLGRHW